MAKWTDDFESLEKLIFSELVQVSKTQIAPYSEKIYKKHAKKTSAKNELTNSTVTVPRRLSKIVKTDIDEKNDKIEITTYSDAEPDESLLKQEIYNDSETLFSEWVENGDWFDLHSWNIAGRPSEHDDYKKPAIPFVKNAAEEVMKNSKIILNMIEKRFNK